MDSPCKILVTGDYGLDYNLYLASADNLVPTTGFPTRWGPVLGGAGIIHSLLNEVAALMSVGGKNKIEVGFGRGSSQGGIEAPHTVALWQPHDLGVFARKLGNENAKVWRLTRSLRLDRTAVLPPAPHVEVPADAGEKFAPHILVVEDDAAGFRIQFPHRCWHPSLEKTGACSPWIILKTTAPLCRGDLWWTLAKPQCPTSRLVAVLSVDDLRREDVRISRGISWERTTVDLIRELKGSPALVGLRLARHVIVVLHGGALWMKRMGTEQWSFQLIFDPMIMEGEWAESVGVEGTAYGRMSCFSAAVATRMALSHGNEIEPNMASVISYGLRAMRLLRVLGHGEVCSAAPGFPFKEMALTLVEDNLTDETRNKVAGLPGGRLALACPKFWTFGKTSISGDVLEREQGPHHWHILETSHARVIQKGEDRQIDPDQEPLYDVAKRVALFGPKALVEAPLVKFGKFQTANRDEIEALNSLKHLLLAYRTQTSDHKPLSVAAFGPPGAGRTFRIKQLVPQVLGPQTPFLDFNLSQFDGVGDLIGAFHQVRDKVLEGHIPVVFWHDFDSGDYQWLQYLLAPMQDGRFQEGQVTHPIGKCVFVFVGAISYDLENFGPKESGAGSSEEEVKAWKEFKLRKGPDFKSRLHGYLNVLGPNRRQKFDRGNTNDNPWQDDPTDVCFPVRRALLLRDLLGLDKERLNIDRALLSALLEVDRYIFGARSLEKIVFALRSDGPGVIRRSSLPPDEVMSMNVNLAEFNKILSRAETFQKCSVKLAPAVNETYRELPKDEVWMLRYDMPFEEPPQDIKAVNVAAAYRIPWILELAGLYLARKESPSDTGDPHVPEILETLLDVLSEEEHDLWMDFKLQQGWRYGEEKNEEARIHNCLVPFDQLKEEDRQKTRNSVRDFPRVVALAGFKIVRRRPR